MYQANRNILLASSLHLPYFRLDPSLVGRNVVLQLTLNLVERLQSDVLNQLVIGAHFLLDELYLVYLHNLCVEASPCWYRLEIKVVSNSKSLSISEPCHVRSIQASTTRPLRIDKLNYGILSDFDLRTNSYEIWGLCDF